MLTTPRERDLTLLLHEKRERGTSLTSIKDFYRDQLCMCGGEWCISVNWYYS